MSLTLLKSKGIMGDTGTEFTEMHEQMVSPWYNRCRTLKDPRETTKDWSRDPAARCFKQGGWRGAESLRKDAECLQISTRKATAELFKYFEQVSTMKEKVVFGKLISAYKVFNSKRKRKPASVGVAR